jgi:hypothetical protein
MDQRVVTAPRARVSRAAGMSRLVGLAPQPIRAVAVGLFRSILCLVFPFPKLIIFKYFRNSIKLPKFIETRRNLRKLQTKILWNP